MTARHLITELRAALEHHVQQTRPIYTTALAIKAATEYLVKPDDQPSTNALIRKLKPISADFVSFRAGYRAAEREHKIGEQ